MIALLRRLLVLIAYLLTGVRAEWRGAEPRPRLRVYFGNHTSHGDFVLVWSALPAVLRARTRPVAGADYWERGALRRFIAARVVQAVLIDRDPATRRADPVAQMQAALASGDSLILFPEGTRNTTAQPLLPLKSGLYHLAERCPEVELIPVWISNVGRVLPKGEVIPIPLLCTVYFGPPLERHPGEGKDAFLARAAAAMLALRPPFDPSLKT